MRYFSIEEANRMVPFLQQTFERIRFRSMELARAGMLLSQQGDRSLPGTPIPEDLADGHRRLRLRRDHLLSKIQEAIDNLTEVGVVVKRGDGLVDFPSRRGDRQVMLCWSFGEPAVDHWHELDDDFEGRQAILRPASFQRAYVN
ncbi:DUF2203 domain-containing protein [Vulgatibacter incomptus]|uniref:DUF2203 domain-containing protein n=1 Tax=Vulgatibacter incomptus TaxID=1391653 RepID=A0A0K1P8V6_9BACT|nr:DUF2203 domain-containing protein [Vulgatibacter incomptus]AKU89963.1 hypothetical protein AKJ08_0350 [Vulgatibacter incomptus]